MKERSILAGSNPWATSGGVRAAYWTCLVVLVALLVLAVVDPPVAPAGGSAARLIVAAALAVSLVVAAVVGVLDGSVLAAVANPVAVALGAVLASVHGMLVGATVPDLSPVGVLLLDTGWLLAAATGGLLAFVVGAGARRLAAVLGRPVGGSGVEKGR